MIWQCRDKKIDCSKKTLIMAIIHVTPDSFSDGGKNFAPEQAVKSALEAQENGADILISSPLELLQAVNFAK